MWCQIFAYTSMLCLLHHAWGTRLVYTSSHFVDSQTKHPALLLAASCSLKLRKKEEALHWYVVHAEFRLFKDVGAAPGSVFENVTRRIRWQLNQLMSHTICIDLHASKDFPHLEFSKTQGQSTQQTVYRCTLHSIQWHAVTPSFALACALIIYCA